MAKETFQVIGVVHKEFNKGENYGDWMFDIICQVPLETSSEKQHKLNEIITDMSSRIREVLEQ